MKSFPVDIVNDWWRDDERGVKIRGKGANNVYINKHSKGEGSTKGFRKIDEKKKNLFT
jgi:hypothetical protein